MGAVVLGSLPDVLRHAGVNIELWPGYETRSRSTGGFEALLGIGHHHDAITAGVPEANRSRSGWDRLDNPNRPVGNARVNRDGTWVIGSLMATNTQGRGPSLRMSKGVIPADRANLYLFSIEPSNDGVGEVWPDVQTESLLTGTAAITLAYGLQPSDSLAHFETAPGRKGDPAGPSRFTRGRNTIWDMDLFRARLAERMVELIAAGKAWGIDPPLPPLPEGDEMTDAQLDRLLAKLDEVTAAVKRVEADTHLLDVRSNWLTNKWAQEMLALARVDAARQGYVSNVGLRSVVQDVARLAAELAGPEA